MGCGETEVCPCRSTTTFVQGPDETSSGILCTVWARACLFKKDSVQTGVGA